MNKDLKTRIQAWMREVEHMSDGDIPEGTFESDAYYLFQEILAATDR